MLKKDITYEDYNGEEVTESFYFNLTKLEMIETELELGGFEDTLEKLNKTQNAKEAYGLFKEILLSSVGQKSEDGRRFLKTPEMRKDFEDSPALSELIMEFLQKPDSAAQFVEGLLPAKLVAEVKKERAQQEKKVETTPELPAGEPQLAPQSESKQLDPNKKATDYSRQELLDMSDDEFKAVAGDDPLKMDAAVMQVAWQRKNAAKIAGQ